MWPTKRAAGIEVGKWIQDRYKRRSRHASIGHISPVAFELQYSLQIADSQKAAQPVSTKRGKATANGSRACWSVSPCVGRGIRLGTLAGVDHGTARR